MPNPPKKNRPEASRLPGPGGAAFRIIFLGFMAGAAAQSAAGLVFPQTGDLSGFKRLKKETRSALYAKALANKDTLYLLLEWKDAKPWAATFSSRGAFEEEWILEQLPRFVPESSPHPLPDPAAKSPETQEWPGLMQQWSLRGRKGPAGWMGSGLRGDRHFLVFRAEAPMPVDEGKGPLRLRREAAMALDTAEGWLSTPCPDPAAWAAIRCYRPGDSPHFLLRVAPYKNMQVEIRLEEGDPLAEVRTAAEALPENGRAEYARDLSALLHGEALRLLSKAARKAPVFTWPDWKFLEWTRGRVSADTYLQAWKKAGRLPDPLPALDFHGDGLRLKVDIHFNGHSRIMVEEAP